MGPQARRHRKLCEVSGHAVDEDVADRLGWAVRKMIFGGTYLICFTEEDDAGVVWVVNFRHIGRC